MILICDEKKVWNSFQAEDGIRDRSPSRGLGDVYKRQYLECVSKIKGTFKGTLIVPK